jgi:murein DD-endopeptidase MepM/ murein hydrolase activator NlpD
MYRKLVAIIGALLAGVAISHAELKTRQPGPFPVGMDTWFGNVYNKTAVHDYRLRVGGWGDEYDTMLRFDLSGLPQTAYRVVFYLYGIPPGDASTPTPIKWYLLSSQWGSDTVGWNNRPNSAYVGYTPAPSGRAVWYGVDLTYYYNQWRTGNPGTLNYGFALGPMYNNNRFDIFHSSGSSLTGARPFLYVFYNPQANDNILKLKWPLDAAYAGRVQTQTFGVDWSAGAMCDGLVKKHNGTDFVANAGDVVYAAEDGVVKETHLDSSGLWASNTVLEHNHPQGGKYTTVYWHINPSVSENDFVPKGMPIGSVANLGGNTHLHFGVRIGPYTQNLSGTGALPQTNCGGYPAFPAGFIDPNSTGNVLFQ